jgi:hypothetical protein
VLLVLLLACRADKDAVLDTVVTRDSSLDSPVDSPVDTDPVDADGDGFTAANDCDDDDPLVNPDAAEICDDIDNDCDGDIDDDDDNLDLSVLTPVCNDDDGDGYGTTDCWQACEGPYGATNSDDCDDTNAGIHPDAEEICDGIDQNCDGADTPCVLVYDFSDPEQAEDFSFETNGCTDGGIDGDALRSSCPDNNDAVHWLDFEFSDFSRLSITATLTSSAWNDGGPRLGIDFGSGPGDWNAWGPTSGYAFLQADPLDSAQGDLCSHGDRCPSIGLNHTSILALADEDTGEGTYTFQVVLEEGAELFSLTHPSGQVSHLTSADASVREGRVGLHCSEGDCAWESVSIAVE